MKRQIRTEISFNERDAAEALEERLTQAGADTSIAWKKGKWSVFARYAKNEAIHVGRIIAEMAL